MQDDGKEIQKKKDTIRLAGCSRREFLQWAGIAIGSTALTSLTLTSCSSSKTTTSETTTANPVETSTSNTSTSASTQPSSSPPISSSTTNAPTTTAPSTTAASGFSYVPPTISPPLLAVTGTTCNVATDRVYSADHIWVKSLSATMVVMGITPTFVEILGEPYKISLPTVGTSLSLFDSFGTIEGYKITADLITPVSGVVFEVDEYVLAQSADGGQIGQINDNPYNSGWLIVVQLSHPNELNSLLSAQAYLKLITK